jgi:surface antigen
MNFSISKRIITSALSVVLLTACVTETGNTYTSNDDGYGYGYDHPSINKRTGGALLGGVGGALIGSQFGKGKGKIATTAIGTLLGAYVGSEAGTSLDRADATYAQESATYAFNTGNAAQWRNPQTGAYGTITPTRTFETQSGSCREFQQTVTINGQAQRAYGTTCLQPDGSWKIVQ